MGSSVVLMQLLVQPGCKLDPCNDLGYKLKGKDLLKWGFVVIFFFFFTLTILLIWLPVLSGK